MPDSHAGLSAFSQRTVKPKRKTCVLPERSRGSRPHQATRDGVNEAFLDELAAIFAAQVIGVRQEEGQGGAASTHQNAPGAGFDSSL